MRKRPLRRGAEAGGLSGIFGSGIESQVFGEGFVFAQEADEFAAVLFFLAFEFDAEILGDGIIHVIEHFDDFLILGDGSVLRFDDTEDDRFEVGGFGGRLEALLGKIQAE